ncbi:MAG: N-6 DNA methylase [Planctomycetes bacterium]|nr:N-6 DNA methylase [Planctomycetota bacterium]
MAKKSTPNKAPRLLTPPTTVAKLRRRRHLFLPKYLTDFSERLPNRPEPGSDPLNMVTHWADMEEQGHLSRKETALDAAFLLEIFGKTLGYASVTERPQKYQLERNFTVDGIGVADGALGDFGTGCTPSPVAVIELKGADVDLDKPVGGRTPVQQCWDYLNALPNCTWGIVSNYSTIRLYHRNRTQTAYEEFSLQDLRNIKRFREFFCIFERGGLMTSSLGQRARALQLLEKTENRQRDVGDELYNYYSDNRLLLIEHLQRHHAKTRPQAIHIAQKLIDRIIFVAFCEDRGLIPGDSLRAAHDVIPPLTRVTNPRWQNFLALFTAMDQGHANLNIHGDGFNGGLFKHDPEVDDLQLSDDWTRFFRQIGEYDFRDEVNVDVLGHLFERSISELERLRTGPLFAEPGVPPEPPAALPRMPKSRERKLLGTYYTPPAFTRFLVEQTVAAIIEQRFVAAQATHGLSQAEIEVRTPEPRLVPYWTECLEILRRLRICDPACGSGAFLIQAYEELERQYFSVIDQLVLHDGPDAQQLYETVPNTILGQNLYGVDLSPQAVEITQLALWIRSAQRGKTLAELSSHIRCGNSLVADRGIHAAAVVWGDAFPEVFSRETQPGFDCIIGNPPWERLKVQEREFFSHSAPKIASAVNAAERRRLITTLEAQDPQLFAAYTTAKANAEQILAYVRTSGAFPNTGKGDVNTYSLFAELALKIVAPHGRVGLLVPSGIATDATTKEFFASLMQSKALLSLFDFENKLPVFPDVHRSFKFCTLVFGGQATLMESADFAFFLRCMEDLDDRNRRISLSIKDIQLLNPNSRTCPIFRTRRDAELTKAIYKRVPILIDRSREQGGNPWGIRFMTIFHQTNDAELFCDAAQLKTRDFSPDRAYWRKGKTVYVPLYEAKMIQAYDHRAASVIIDAGNWMRQGQTESTTLVDHQNPEFFAQPRWWVAETDLAAVLGQARPPAFLAFKDVTSPTNQRTMIAAFIPPVGAVNSAPLILTGTEINERAECCLLANLNSFALDFVARQKVGNVHLNFFIVEQLPIFPPSEYAERCPWNKKQTLEKWISDRVLKLTCTADDMRPLAAACAFEPGVHKWKPDERAELQAELDAAYFHLYGISRDDAAYILSTFTSTSVADESTPSLYRTDNLILAAYDRLGTKQ